MSFSDILYFLKGALYVIAIVLIMMTPFFGYLYWLNNKQNRYFKKLGKELNLEYKSLGNKIKRDFPELNGFIKGIPCFIGARRTKGRYGSSAATRNHYPIIMIELAIKKDLEHLNLKVSGEKILHSCSPSVNLNATTFKKLQNYANDYGNILITQSKKGVIQVLIANKLSNQKQYEKVVVLIPILAQLAIDINLNK